MAKITRKYLILTILGLIVFNSVVDFVIAEGSDNTPSNKGKQKHQIGPGRSQFQYGTNLNLNINSNSNLSLDIEYDENLANRMLGLDFNTSNGNDNNLSISMDNSFAYSPSYQYNWSYNNSQYAKNAIYNPEISQSIQSSLGNPPIEVLSTDQDSVPDYKITYDYNTYYILNFSESIDSLILFTENLPDLGIDPPSGAESFWALFNNDTQSWDILPSTTNNTEIRSTLPAENLDSSQYIFTLIYLKPIIPAEGLSSTLIALIAIGGLIALSFGILMTNEKYREYLLNRILVIQKGPHHLTMEQILENETRDELIKIILEEPGIHFNELLRKSGIAAGTLVWHLDILDTYKIIKKERVGQYLTYYCYLYKNPISNLDLQLSKSQTTLNILNFIQENEGCFQSKIAKVLKLNHKTIKYHLDKLEELGLLEIGLKGKRKIFSINKDFKFNSLDDRTS